MRYMIWIWHEVNSMRYMKWGKWVGVMAWYTCRVFSNSWYKLWQFVQNPKNNTFSKITKCPKMLRYRDIVFTFLQLILLSEKHTHFTSINTDENIISWNNLLHYSTQYLSARNHASTRIQCFQQEYICLLDKLF